MQHVIHKFPPLPPPPPHNLQCFNASFSVIKAVQLQTASNILKKLFHKMYVLTFLKVPNLLSL